MKGPPVDARTRAIVAAVQSGVTYRVIADVYGISRQRVGQIARRAGWTPAKPQGQGRRDTGTHGLYAYRVLRCRCAVCRQANTDDSRRESKHR